ncbi:hypothetical protein GCM10009753_26250 [Streptantibioticus ferralitis]
MSDAARARASRTAVVVNGREGEPACAKDTVPLTRAPHLVLDGAPLAPGPCPLSETLRVARWLAGQSAGQCGPCRDGLPGLADALADLLDGGGPGALEGVRQAARAVSGRGACKPPDGSSRFVLSALAAFTDDLASHVLGGGCGRPTAVLLPAAAPGSRTAARGGLDAVRGARPVRRRTAGSRAAGPGRLPVLVDGPLPGHLTGGAALPGPGAAPGRAVTAVTRTA